MSTPSIVKTPSPPAGSSGHNATAFDQSIDARFTTQLNKNNPSHFVPNFADRGAWEKRAEHLRKQTLVTLGLWPLWPKTPLNPTVHGKVDRGGYTIEKVFFTSVPGHYVTGNLYRPTKAANEKSPVILRPYGHWPGGRFIWRSDDEIAKEIASGAEKTREGARSPQQASCAMLARMGCVVFQFDMVGYCDSKSFTHKDGFLDAECVLRAQNFMGLQTWNSIRALDFVLTLADADEKRVGITGASQGGMQAFTLATLDERISAMFLVCSVSMTMQGGCVCGNVPSLRVDANNVEFAAMFAPKPLGICAAHDWTSNFETLGLPEIRSIYGLYGAAEQVSCSTFPYPHNFNLHSRQAMYEFMNRQFKLGWAEPVTEAPFDPLPPEELSVWDERHPYPSDALDAAGMRKWMTRISSELLDVSPAEFVKIFGEALPIFVNDQMPEASEVEIIEGGPLGGELWNGTFRRKGTRERVPARAIFPKGWNGTLVVWSHPEGAGTLVESDPLVQVITKAKAAIIAADVFMSGTFWREPLPPPANPSGKPHTPFELYIGMRIGYERTIFSNRVHDLLSVMALGRRVAGRKSLRLIAFGEIGAAALVARALAGEKIDRAAIDLNQFDFDQVTENSDPMLLPGALKYGGISGISRLCPAESTQLYNRRGSSNRADPAQMIAWLLDRGAN